MYLVVARATARPDSRDEVARLLTGAADASRSENGCLSYHFTSDLEDPASFASIEVWQDKDALLAHLAGPGVAQLLEKLGPLVAEPPSITGYEVPGEADRLA